ncbi:fungal-trans domain-containing protein [Favolaschia claudopus]|uniref:Fungal-trans domain-containing protein n=1 Tax=Favolaschia claudopus TaxID=2862362 RepID=A0AAW0A0T0_9AGAR
MADETLEASYLPPPKNQRSCDVCKHKKIRCDGLTANRPDNTCSHCLQFGVICTYLQPVKKRGRKMIKKLTTEDMQKEIDRLTAELQAVSVCSRCSKPLRSKAPDALRTPALTPDAETASSESDDDGDALDIQQNLVHRFSHFALDANQNKYFGLASNLVLANDAIAIKQQHMGPSAAFPFRRRIFWDTLPWEKEALNRRPHYVYPANDLISTLVAIYFDTIHPIHPILHRPSFERSVAQGLHLVNQDFGGTLLAVLASASRYSNDARVFVGKDVNTASLSAGWKFASQIQPMNKIVEPTLYEVQTYALLSLFMIGSSGPQASWVYIGLGIRCLQQRGEHRKKPETYKAKAEDELWKRAFWTFVGLEPIVCLCLGRPMGLRTEEYDLDCPIDADDEYMDNGWVQPPDKPSRYTYFIYHLRLSKILSDAMRRLYGSKRERTLLGWTGPEWEERIVKEFDKAMSDFRESIPAHLRWDPENPPQDRVFFDQSVTLYVTYNYILTAIHRPFIQKRSPLTTASLSICAAAARTIIQTADMWFKKFQRLPLSHINNPVFVSGVILILCTLGNKRAGIPTVKNEDLARVSTAMGILKYSESRLQPVGRLWELLQELWSFDKPLPIDVSSTSSETESDPPSSSSEPIIVPPPAESCPVKPGMSIEELLAAAGTSDSMNGTLDADIMSMWMAAPCDNMHLEPWSAYYENARTDGPQFMGGNWMESSEGQ